MTYDDLIEFYGTQEAAAGALGIKQPSVADWKKGGIPEPRQAQYQIITNGKLKADIPQPSKAAA
jgi:hypothetical protein